jgi:methylene-fatty-acyl-phospholipid synthase
MFAASAVVLSLERVTYAAVWRWPASFALACHRLKPGSDPVDVVAALFVVFKAMQATVFMAWCIVHGGSLTRASDGMVPLVAGAMLIAAGQVLTLSVFARLGRIGVFYGIRFGRDVPWCTGFPFGWIRHPQYVGTAISIWGFFLVLRYPASDWAALPLLETLYYGIGSLVEQPPAAGIITSRSRPETGADPRASTRLP